MTANSVLSEPIDSASPGQVSQGTCLSAGIELLGEYEGSGLKEPPYLLRTPEGRIIQLSKLIYLIAANLDGSRDFEQVAVRVSQAFGRPVSASNVEVLVGQQLVPLGLTSGSAPPAPVSRPVLGLTWRSALVPKRTVSAVAGIFRPLFHPFVVFLVVAGVIAVDGWLLFAHGIGAGVVDVLQAPELQLAFSAVIFASGAFHELGHASACRYGGVQPGAVGVGIYLVWPVFYNDVTEGYRLNRAGRLRIDFGGVYFDAIAALVTMGVYLITDFEPLLLVVVVLQINALHQFLPFLRFDGYYILSDLTGVPDLFTQVKPMLASFFRRRATPVASLLKPRVRRILVVWAVLTGAFLAFAVVSLVVLIPRYLPVAWAALGDHFSALRVSADEANVPGVLLNVVRIAILVVPFIGGGLVGVKLFAVARARVQRRRRRVAPETPRLTEVVPVVTSLEARGLSPQPSAPCPSPASPPEELAPGTMSGNDDEDEPGSKVSLHSHLKRSPDSEGKAPNDDLTLPLPSSAPDAETNPTPGDPHEASVDMEHASPTPPSPVTMAPADTATASPQPPSLAPGASTVHSDPALIAKVESLRSDTDALLARIDALEDTTSIHRSVLSQRLDNLAEAVLRVINSTTGATEQDRPASTTELRSGGADRAHSLGRLAGQMDEPTAIQADGERGVDGKAETCDGVTAEGGRGGEAVKAQPEVVSDDHLVAMEEALHRLATGMAELAARVPQPSTPDVPVMSLDDGAIQMLATAVAEALAARLPESTLVRAHVPAPSLSSGFAPEDSLP